MVEAKRPSRRRKKRPASKSPAPSKPVTKTAAPVAKRRAPRRRRKKAAAVSVAVPAPAAGSAPARPAAARRSRARRSRKPAAIVAKTKKEDAVAAEILETSMGLSLRGQETAPVARRPRARRRPARTRQPRAGRAASPIARRRSQQATRHSEARLSGNDKLRAVVRKPEASVYEITGDSPLRRYIFSTPETVKLLNTPEAVGIEPSFWLREGIAAMLRALPRDISFADCSDRNTGVVHFLRGGLAFSMREVLHAAYGMNLQLASFMTSQRYRSRDTWVIKQDQYRKFSLPPDGTIFLADILATGATIDNGLGVLLQTLKKEKKCMRNFVFVTVGCQRAEDILSKYHRKFKAAFGKRYRNTYLFYIEGRFALAGAVKSPVISLPGTDLLRYPALLTPEFELSQYRRIHIPLERCVIYDMGTKIFDYAVFLEELKQYWQRLMGQGVTLVEAYKERWPLWSAISRDELQREVEKLWPDADSGYVGALHAARVKTCKYLEDRGTTRASLIRVCCDRVKQIERIL